MLPLEIVLNMVDAQLKSAATSDSAEAESSNSPSMSAAYPVTAVDNPMRLSSSEEDNVVETLPE
ncbi:hypothetical protein KIN20_026836 [Parelaphostrongylus tenuis]|uniref:Uncharacterized protein n=1 Tax=Parelaphostrongylus tenuis TaxID=148309 RepID=A0AAD5QYJ8_PARTN|nr:hypothetical protein KIN20_026836 [Parelaphostrongylus tenuis]